MSVCVLVFHNPIEHSECFVISFPVIHCWVLSLDCLLMKVQTYIDGSCSQLSFASFLFIFDVLVVVFNL